MGGLEKEGVVYVKSLACKGSQATNGDNSEEDQREKVAVLFFV